MGATAEGGRSPSRSCASASAARQSGCSVSTRSSAWVRSAGGGAASPLSRARRTSVRGFTAPRSSVGVANRRYRCPPASSSVTSLMRWVTWVGTFSIRNHSRADSKGSSVPAVPPSSASCRNTPSICCGPGTPPVRRRTSGRNDSSADGSNSRDVRNASSSSYSSPICAFSARTPTRPLTSSALIGTRSATSPGGGRKASGST